MSKRKNKKLYECSKGRDNGRLVGNWLKIIKEMCTIFKKLTIVCYERVYKKI